jgi:aminodeoxychorismate lyase
MIVFLNGKFVPEEQAVISVFDRAFLYGDGLFEGILINNGTPFRWREHFERFARGAEFLAIQLPFDAAQSRGFVATLVRENRMPNAFLRITLSRGVGLRGYSPRGARSPVVVMALYPTISASTDLPARCTLKTSSFKLPSAEPLAQFKNCNKLLQVLARAQAEQAGADEALLLNTDGFVVEAAASNLFWIDQDCVQTPPLLSGVLPGVTRQVVLEIVRNLKIQSQERNITSNRLLDVAGVFLSTSSLGILEAASLDDHPLRQCPLTAKIHHAYWDIVRDETQPG